MRRLRLRAQRPPKHRAPSWPGNSAADAPISFADIRRLPDPDWIGRSQNIAFALDAELLEPLKLTDWQARIAADWQDVTAWFGKLRVRIVAEQIGVERSYGVGVCMLTAPLIAECEALQAELAPFTAKAGC